MMLNETYLRDLKKYLDSDDFGEDFSYAAEERRLEIMDFLELCMELGESADGAASKIIFKNIQFTPPSGPTSQK